MGINHSLGSKPGLRKVLLAGATGLVGREILRLLLRDKTVGEVQVLGRREPGVLHPKMSSRVVDFRQLPALAPVDEVFLALGTTIGVAGSRQAFRAVDFDANLAVAQAGMAAGARRVALVSVMNADATSRFFYTRTKGELEAALAGLPLEALVIARPSLLLGDRAALKQPPRLVEKLSIWVSRVIAPVLPRDYQPVGADAVARALLVTPPTAQGTVVLSSGELLRLGRS
jgi:uncharacterized protein YbjT (DUF2867 family)